MCLGRWRKHAGLSQTKAAGFLGVSYSYYHKIEAHKRTPGLKLAHKIFEKCRGDDDEPLVPMQRWCERYEFRKRTPVPPVPEKYPSEPLIVMVGDRRMLRIRDGWMPLDD